MSSTLRPDSADAMLDAVRWAAAEETPLEILGHGSRRSVGRLVQAEFSLDLSALSGVTLYEPEELVLSARAGTPLAEIETLLSEHNQALAFEPMDHGPIGGAARGRGTIGGVLASNSCGPRRIKAGAARDHVLGVKAVSGRGEAFKAGGRVVKNVTGYDLSKGLAGSWGTLAAITEVTYKVLPKPETEATLVLSGLADGPAITTLCAAMGTAWEVSGAAHLPEATVSHLPEDTAPAGGAVTLLRLEGFAPSVAYRIEKLQAQFSGTGESAVLDEPRSAALWRAVRDAEAFAGSARPLWRASVAPTTGPWVVAALADHHAIRWFYDWSGGLIWMEDWSDDADALAFDLRMAIKAAGGGHATLVRGVPALRAAVSPFEPQPDALAALSRRLKAQFDPKGILNPGRM